MKVSDVRQKPSYSRRRLDMSAYELAVIYGYKKSYDEWLIDLLT